MIVPAGVIRIFSFVFDNGNQSSLYMKMLFLAMNNNKKWDKKLQSTTSSVPKYKNLKLNGTFPITMNLDSCLFRFVLLGNISFVSNSYIWD